MKFLKGIVTGMVITCGAYMAYAECNSSSNKMLKKGKKIMKKLGI